MNWIAFAAVAWISLGLELGLRDALQLGNSSIAPSFALLLVLFVAMWAPLPTVIGASLTIGVLVDLTRLVPVEGSQSIAVLGPHALGYLLGAYAVVTLRAIVFRKSLLTIAILCLIGGSVAASVIAALLTVRSTTDASVLIFPGQLLWEGLGSAVYSAVAALFLSPLQRLLIPLLGFRKAASRGIDRWN